MLDEAAKSVLTLDAAHTPKTTAQTIVQKGAISCSGPPRTY
jgi:hypothetical protein